MPNQLSTTKQRLSLAEHKATLAALNEIAEQEQTTASNLVRLAIRRLVAKRATDPAMAEPLRRAVMAATPRVPPQFRSAAQVARFKRQQRELDLLLQELNLAKPGDVQTGNSVVRNRANLRLVSMT
jgi:uncharacterized protein (DUF2236 family)